MIRKRKEKEEDNDKDELEIIQGIVFRKEKKRKRKERKGEWKKGRTKRKTSISPSVFVLGSDFGGNLVPLRGVD